MMRLLEAGICLLAVFSVLSLFLGLTILQSDLEGEPSWASISVDGGTSLHDAAPQVAKKDVVIKSTTDGNGIFKENSQVLKKIDHPQITTPVSTRFFPTYGTNAFFRQCGWTTQRSKKHSNCTFLARPNPQTNEGISDWIPQIVSGHLMAQQKGCQLLFDYGDNVDMDEVLTPFPVLESVRSAGYQPINWTVPSDFDCPQNKHPRTCFRTTEDYRNGINFQKIIDDLGPMSLIPSYRFTYLDSPHFQLNATRFENLKHALPGFTVENGMACSLGSLFHLSPNAAKFEPDLFTRILPTLYQDNTLVMSLYIRTGQTDFVASMEKDGKGPPEEEFAKVRGKAERIIQCAQHVQEERKRTESYSRVVWLIATDSPYLKQWIPKLYDTHANANTVDVPREIVTTHSRGVHTRAQRGPSTADFAEALIDWYLIGESDLVISDWNSPTFGGTASLRTARPYYKVPATGDPTTCAVAPIVHNDNGKAAH